MYNSDVDICAVEPSLFQLEYLSIQPAIVSLLSLSPFKWNKWPFKINWYPGKIYRYTGKRKAKPDNLFSYYVYMWDFPQCDWNVPPKPSQNYTQKHFTVK